MQTDPRVPVPELAGIEVHGISRGAFLTRSALAAGAVYGLGSVGPFVGQALARADAGDVDIVNFALTLEYLETAFYTKALTLGLSAEVRRLATLIQGDEAQHVAALVATARKLGGTPVTRPRFTFPMTDEASFLKLAQTLEDTGVSAYNGAGPSIRSKDVLAAAGSIVQVEARHAAAIRLQNGVSPAPAAFDTPLDEAAVLAAVRPFVVT